MNTLRTAASPIASGLHLRAAADRLLAQRRRLVFGVTALVLIVFWTWRVTGASLEKDAAETLRMAVNLAHEGIASDDESAPFHPGMKREPAPVIATAVVVKVMDALVEPAPLRAYFSGDRARVLKYQNVLWLALLCGAIYAALRFFASSPLASLTGVLLVNLPLLHPVHGPTLVDSLYTEAPAAALLALGSFLLVQGVSRRQRLAMAAAGVVFGLLALTKAVFLYVFGGVLITLIIAKAVAWTLGRAGVRSGDSVILTGCFLIVVVPWMYRNYSAVGHFAITERGGDVLYVRALKDRMTAVEVRGALYYWAPRPVRNVLGHVFGFSPADLERGQRLQRLNRWETSSFAADDLAAEKAGRPEDAVTYYRKSRAELTRLTHEFRDAGRLAPALEAGAVLQRRAIQMILERPTEHIAMSFVFLWRGAFFAFPLFVLAYTWAAWRRDYRLALFITPAFGMVMFYALFSHFIARYGLPAMPIAIAAAVVVATRLASRRADRAVPRTPS